MTTSAMEREEVLDIIYTALTNPNDSGNCFLHQLLSNAKDGYFSLNLLKGLVVKLAPYPLTYLQHCIKQDQKHQPNKARLELSPDSTKVRKTRSTGNIQPETDPYGFLVTKSPVTTSPELGKNRQIPTDISSNKQQRGSYFTPYRPAFNYKALDEADDEMGDNDYGMDLLPVIFDNGKFYQDASFFNSTNDVQAGVVPSYNKLDMIPIGSEHTYSNIWSPLKQKTCWNCESPGHETRQCPESVNRERVEINRAAFLADKGSTPAGRYYERLAYDDEVSGLEPGRLSSNLRQALGILDDQDEPPYYRAMRTHGYPPGYTGTYAEQEHVMKLVSGNRLSEDIPDLKIFGRHEDYDSLDHDEIQKQDGPAKGHEERIRMVTYPGLYPPERTTNEYQHPVSQSYDNQPLYTSAQQYYNQQSYPTPYDYDGQWGYYQSADLHQIHTEHQPIQYQHNLHNQSYIIPPSTHHDDFIPPPPPPTGTEDDTPPPPPPPIDIQDDVPPPPPPPIDIQNDTPSPPPPPPYISLEHDNPPPPPPPPPSISLEHDNPPPPSPIS